VRLCDGAIIVVDVVEGVCPQVQFDNIIFFLSDTHNRLVTELKLSPLQAYDRLLQTVEQVNSILAEMFAAEILQKNYYRAQHKIRPDANKNTQMSNISSVIPEDFSSIEKPLLVYDWVASSEKTVDSDLYFNPSRGNVIFSSAIDTWGFRLVDFARIWADRLGIQLEELKLALWGDWYLTSEKSGVTSKDLSGGEQSGSEVHVIKNGARSKGKKPIFVQLVLEQLWSSYEVRYNALLLPCHCSLVFMLLSC
ncbi:unnamed protein product, partial [Protopolystoma xenopodis]